MWSAAELEHIPHARLRKCTTPLRPNMLARRHWFTHQVLKIPQRIARSGYYHESDRVQKKDRCLVGNGPDGSSYPLMAASAALPVSGIFLRSPGVRPLWEILHREPVAQRELAD